MNELTLTQRVERLAKTYAGIASCSPNALLQELQNYATELEAAQKFNNRVAKVCDECDTLRQQLSAKTSENELLCEFINNEALMTANDPRIESLVKGHESLLAAKTRERNAWQAMHTEQVGKTYMLEKELTATRKVADELAKAMRAAEFSLSGQAPPEFNSAQAIIYNALTDYNNLPK